MRKLWPLLLILAGLVTPLFGSPPNTPANATPADGSGGVPAGATICAQVTDPDLDPLTVRFFGRDLTEEPGENFTLVVLPDTQYYAQQYHDIFFSQIDWIIEQRKARNIAFVSHVGDIVQIAASEVEWDVTDEVLSRLEDPATTELEEGIPYGLAVGNHDQSPNDHAGSLENPGSTTVLFNEYFGVSRFEGRSYYGGHYGDNNDNSYQLFSAGGMDFIAIHLEFYPNIPNPLADSVLAWADGVLKAHPDRRAIVTSHHLLCPTQTCPPLVIESPFSPMGQAVYAALKDNPNLFLMPNGHGGQSDFMTRRTDTYQGNTVHTLMSNYHFGEPCPFLCGNGFLRIMTFEPALNRISVETYSPWLDEYKADQYGEFTLDYDMNEGIQFKELGTLEGVTSGLSPCIVWTGRAEEAQYEWYVEVTDGTDTTVGPIWDFSSDGSCTLAGECDDGDSCTVDLCRNRTCVHNPKRHCCTEVADCDDGNWCTDESCVNGVCGKVNNSRACDDGNGCTENDVCGGGSCAGTALTCDDSNDCTQDSCSAGACDNSYLPTPGCCTVDSDCEDANPCTADSCNSSNACEHVARPDCCLDDSECGDSDPCTADICTPRNLGAARLESPYDHVTMMNFGMGGGTEAPFLGASTFTLECWFNWSGDGVPTPTSGYPWWFDPGGIEAYPLIAKGIRDSEFHPMEPWLDGLTSVNYFLGIGSQSHVLEADFEEHPSGPNPHSNHPVVGKTVIAPNVWHHAAVTYDGSCWQLYLDGQPETDGTNCPGVLPAYDSRHFFALGVGQGWAGFIMGYFGGMLDEPRVWKRALSQQEIQAQMHTQIRSHPDLLGRWSLDEVGIAEDTTGNKNVGVFVGAGVETIDIPDLGGRQCANRLPEDVTGLVLSPAVQCDFFNCNLPPQSTRLRWLEPSIATLPYDVVSGTVGQLHVEGGTGVSQCLSENNPDASYRDYRPKPQSGQIYYYMIREQGVCGGGSYGTATGGAERETTGACSAAW